MNTYKVTYTDSTHYTTDANGTLEEFTAYLMQFLLDLPNQPEGEIIEVKMPNSKAERRHAVLARLDEALKPYEWTTDFTSIFNRKGTAVHTMKIKGNRVQLFDGDTIRASLAQPENIGQYIEKTFYAVKVTK